jgi:anti-sigma B factor antagonist
MPADDGKLLRAGPHAVITMPAEIDMTNADQIREALLAAVSDRASLIIDMSGTTFCDSAGVRAIISASRQAAVAGTQVRLVATAVLRIFTMIGADQLIPTYPTLEASLAKAPAGQASTRDPR